MNYRHALFAAVLASVGFSASAQDTVIVAPEEACPPRTVAGVASYSWKDGRFVLDGWVCESVDKGRN